MIKNKYALKYALIFECIALASYFVVKLLPEPLNIILYFLSSIVLIVPNLFSWWIMAVLGSIGFSDLLYSGGDPSPQVLTFLTLVSTFFFGYVIGAIFNKSKNI